MLRPCIGCGTPTNRTRCQSCIAVANRARGSATARGYGAAHIRAADTDPDYVDATHCTHCGQPFTAGNPKQRGHATPRRTGQPDNGHRLPHCRTCNAGWRKSGL